MYAFLLSTSSTPHRPQDQVPCMNLHPKLYYFCCLFSPAPCQINATICLFHGLVTSAGPIVSHAND